MFVGLEGGLAVVQYISRWTACRILCHILENHKKRVNFGRIKSRLVEVSGDGARELLMCVLSKQTTHFLKLDPGSCQDRHILRPGQGSATQISDFLSTRHVLLMSM
jgi:hypothetical protein